MVDFNTANKLMITSATTQPTPSTQPSTNLQGNQICMSDFYTAQIQFANTPEENFQYQ